MKLIISDGGRSNYFKGTTGDCVVRAICNATGKDYKEVYNDLWEMQFDSPRNGVKPKVYKKYIEDVLGWTWCNCMEIGKGCKVHLNEFQLPNTVLIVRLSKHLTCVKNRVLYDTYDCSRNGTRCVYGFWYKEKEDS